MNTARPRSAKPHAAASRPPAPDVAADEPSIWDTLSDEDRASIERGLAQSLAGIHTTDEEAEGAFAAFGP